MNTIRVVPFSNPQRMFKPTFIAVEGISEDGYPCTLAVIYHNKHGRHNLMNAAGGGFYAGSKNLGLVKKYAKDFSIDDGVFLDSAYKGHYVTYVHGPKKGTREFRGA